MSLYAGTFVDIMFTLLIFMLDAFSITMPSVAEIVALFMVMSCTGSWAIPLISNAVPAPLHTMSEIWIS